MYMHRDKVAKLERRLSVLLTRVQTLRAHGVSFRQGECDALAVVIREFRSELRRLAESDPEWAKKLAKDCLLNEVTVNEG